MPLVRFHRQFASICCGMLLTAGWSAAWAAEPIAPEPPTTAILKGPWTKLDTYLKENFPHQPPSKPDWTGAQEQAAALPSLGDDTELWLAAPNTTAIKHEITFAALPAMFEQRHAAPAVEDKPKPVPAVTPAVAQPEPKPPEECAPSLSKEAAAAASDRATLEALRQAVKDLHLEQDLNFLTAPKAAKTVTPAESAAPSKK